MRLNNRLRTDRLPIRAARRQIPREGADSWVRCGDDFPANCPSGPHIKPELLALKNGGEHPDGSIQASQQFGAGWQYWSRPFPNWNGSGRTGKVYMEHIDRLFDQ